MAVWQWKVYLAQREQMVSLFQIVPEFLNDEKFYSIEWSEYSEPEKYEKVFDTILPRSYYPGSSPDVKSWGTNNDNEIDMCFEDEKLTDIGIKINTQEVDMPFIKAIVNFARENNLVFWTNENDSVFEPKLEIFLEKFYQSRAMLFFQNPKAFFEDKQYFDDLQQKITGKLKPDS